MKSTHPVEGIDSSERRRQKQNCNPHVVLMLRPAVAAAVAEVYTVIIAFTLTMLESRLAALTNTYLPASEML
jgi:hypothetical protein